MDELRAVEEAKLKLKEGDREKFAWIIVSTEVLRALLARAMRPHD